MILEYIFGGAVVISGVGAVCYYLRKVNNNLINLGTKLASLQDDDNHTSGTVLLPVTRMDVKAECNTVLPLPMGAEMCNHSMDVVTNQVIRAPHEEKCVVVLQCTKCGAIDKTIAATSPPPKPPPPPPLPRSECRHQWVKEKTVTLPSAFEQMEDLLKERNRSKNGAYDPRKKEEEKHFDPSTAPPWMFSKTMCRERLCTKCGEVDRVVMSNFDVKTEQEDNG